MSEGLIFDYCNHPDYLRREREDFDFGNFSRAISLTEEEEAFLKIQLKERVENDPAILRLYRMAFLIKRGFLVYCDYDKGVVKSLLREVSLLCGV